MNYDPLLQQAEMAPSVDYPSMLEKITSRKLDARSVDTYADDALDDLVGLVQTVVDEYPSAEEVSGLET